MLCIQDSSLDIQSNRMDLNRLTQQKNSVVNPVVDVSFVCVCVCVCVCMHSYMCMCVFLLC